MNAALRNQVMERAGGRCEYCRLSRMLFIVPGHIEHIIPRQHGGSSSPDNLALACAGCNGKKGPNLTGLDPDTGAICRLFHPRQDGWSDHFRLEGWFVRGLTSIGRTTVWLLEMNSARQIGRRKEDTPP